MLTIAYVLGTRPEVIRSAAMLELLSTDPEIELQVIDTGQHYDDDMLGGFLRELSIPHLDARLSVGSAAAAEQTARVMQGVHDVLAATTPRCGRRCSPR